MFPSSTIQAIQRDQPALNYAEACSVASRRGHALRAIRKHNEERRKARENEKAQRKYFWQD